MNTKNLLTIQQRLPVQPITRPGFRAEGIRGDYAMKDPFIMADHYRMSQPVFGPHPHAGFSAVTYMFDDAETGFSNRDSRGDSSEIQAGDAHWTVAGAGVVHDEVPIINGKVAHGLQLFVNLAAKDKHMPPVAIHIRQKEMPRVVQVSGARVKLAFGSYNDGTQNIASVKLLPTEVTLLDVTLRASESFRYPIAEGVNAFMMVIGGDAIIAGESVAENQAVAFGRGGGELEVRTSSATQFALFIGKPLNEPIVQHGPFAMTNQTDIERAIADYQTGKMGFLEAI
jgi:redox-sensitive bicupin YhaK (pirin superfamily)